MKPKPFSYVRASSAEEAVRHLAEHGEDAKLLAGVQTLVPMMNMRVASPGVLVDVSECEALRYIGNDGGGVRVGALTRYRDIEESQIIGERLPLLAMAVPHIAHLA